MKAPTMVRPFYILLFLSLSTGRLFADEGMYPLSEIHKLDLKSKGLKVTPKQIYNPGHVSFIDAIVQVGGCTGSFISNDGLIITNHHCAFGAVQSASSKDHDYITDGYLARAKKDELSATGYTVRITESYKDVSKEVLTGLNDTMDLAARTRAIEKKIKEIVAVVEKDNPGKRAEVSEMFTGKSYMLFIYTFLKDVRVVYVPPRSIGEFGGEDDNWMWPRHTGDFSFLRAYVAPDGSPAEYAPENVPYHPRKYLVVNPNGVDENDPVFILGYPGRTFRHRTSHYLGYEEEIRMPYVADLNEWEIRTMEAMGKGNKAVAIKHAGRIKSLANTMKNFRGKLKGLKRLSLVERKREEERDLQRFIESDPSRNATYGTLLNDIGIVYDEMHTRAGIELTLDYLKQAAVMVNVASMINDAARERAKPDLERESAYMERNFNRTKESLRLTLQNYDEQTDRIFLKEMLMRATRLPAGQRIAAIDSIIGDGELEGSINTFIDNSYKLSRLGAIDVALGLMDASPESLAAITDPFLMLARGLAPHYRELKETRQRRDGGLSKLSALLAEVKEQYLKKDFIPDANSTLRLTFGKIRGYSPADAVYAAPITTLQGLIDKTTGVEPYDTPKQLIEMYKKKEFGRYKQKRLKDVPVALLYNLDTTGGNSGSPLLNAQGEVVGVNFDRCLEATINDYAWSEAYSRSIAVDIRYVLWVTEKVAGATELIKEIGAK